MKFQNILFVFATVLFTVVTADTLLRSQPLKIAKRDTLLKALPVKHKEDRRKVVFAFKNGEEDKHESEAVKHREDKARLMITLKNGEASNQHQESIPIKQKEDKKAVIFFKNEKESEFKKIARRATLLKSLPTDDKRVQQDALLNARYQNLKGISKRDTLLRSLYGSDKRAKVIDPKASVRVFLKSGKVDETKRPLTAAEKKKDIDLKKYAMITFKNADNKNLSGNERTLLAARQRDAVRAFFKNRRAVAQRDTLLRDENQPEQPRKKREIISSIAATVVGAAVSSVVSNLMKNVEESVVKAENDAKKMQADLDSDQGRIIGQGELIVSQDTAQFAPNKAPVANEVVPLPFAPVKAYDASRSNDFVPKPVAPVHADVEVISGTNVASTASTAKPATEKKGIFATLFNSIKLFFGTVTNSVGGFFIDMGSRITNFVEKRIKV